MRHNLVLYLISSLSVLQAAIASPTKTDGSALQARKLRQTTWEEIQGRQNSRTRPLNRRQMPSTVPITCPSCPATYSDMTVARYPATDIVQGDVSLPENL